MLIPTKSAIPFGARKKLLELLVAFSDSAFTFHLAGSYYFGVATDESDVDLYVGYSPALLVWLRDHGFYRLGAGGTRERTWNMESEKYNAMTHDESDYTHGVFEHTEKKVHVQVFYDLNIALRARDILATCFNAEHTRTRGDDRSAMWRAALDAARVILNAASPAA